jgi:radical SAM superfamily enzyme YgiQ (UPF0313 family)
LLIFCPLYRNKKLHVPYIGAWSFFNLPKRRIFFDFYTIFCLNKAGSSYNNAGEIMKVVFITPASDLRRTLFYRIGNHLYGHSNAITGPLILGHILKKAGHEVEVYEELYQDIDFQKIKNADVFCISTITSTAPRAYKIADQLHQETRARVIIGGMHASALPKEAADHGDQVIVGEAEAVIVGVVEGSIKDPIVYAECLKNLDDIPFPDYSLLKTSCDCANVMSTRGCPFCCSFCTTSRMFYPYRERSVDSVISELRYYKELGFKYMNFEDDNFTANKERAKEICRRMIKENLTFKETFFFGRTDMAEDEELLDLCEKAHLSRVLIGLESLNQESLNAIDKHQATADIRKCVKALSRHKIRLIASIVLGIDTDNERDIKHSIAFAKRNHAYQLQPAVLTPYPKTKTYEQLEKEDRLITRDWSVFDMMNVTFLPRQMSPWKLQKLFLSATYRFYSCASSFQIWRIFGVHYGLRRFGLALLVKAVIPAMYLNSLANRNSHIYKIRHFPLNQKQETELMEENEPIIQ